MNTKAKKKPYDETVEKVLSAKNAISELSKEEKSKLDSEYSIKIKKKRKFDYMGTGFALFATGLFLFVNTGYIHSKEVSEMIAVPFLTLGGLFFTLGLSESTKINLVGMIIIFPLYNIFFFYEIDGGYIFFRLAFLFFFFSSMFLVWQSLKDFFEKITKRELSLSKNSKIIGLLFQLASLILVIIQISNILISK